MKIDIRKMQQSDIAYFYEEFKKQGWDKPTSLFEGYLKMQENGEREIFVGTVDGVAAGYTTLLKNDSHGPFADKSIPTICDFNVLEKFQGHGIGTAILDAVEERALSYCDSICLGVGLHSGYGSAQRLYVKRGYIPDGSGVWYQDKPLANYADCKNDDDLVLYMQKKLK